MRHEATRWLQSSDDSGNGEYRNLGSLSESLVAVPEAYLSEMHMVDRLHSLDP